MIHYIHRHPKFEQALRSLQKQGGTALSAAKKTEEIIQKMLEKGRENSLKVGRLTRKGELRIERGIKFDLGNGYRLVCAKHGTRLTLLYIGTHDECSRWLERNKGFHYEIGENDDTKLTTRESPSAELSPINRSDPPDEYEDQLMEKIDDKILRKVFRGLVEKNS